MSDRTPFFPNGPNLARDEEAQRKPGKKLSMDSIGDHVQCVPHGLRSDHCRKYLRSHRFRIPEHEPSKLDINQLPHHQHCFSTTIRVHPRPFPCADSRDGPVISSADDSVTLHPRVSSLWDVSSVASREVCLV